MANPQDIIQKIKEKDRITFVHDIHLIQILDKPIYQIIYSKGQESGKKTQLADAQTGEIRAALSEKEAVEIAKKAFSDNAQVKQVEYLTTTNGHHEYRELTRCTQCSFEHCVQRVDCSCGQLFISQYAVLKEHYAQRG